MTNYFYDMLPEDELSTYEYYPTLCDLVRKMETSYANEKALSNLAVTYDYKTLCHRIGQRRAFIKALGLPKGSVIGVFDRNSIDAVELFLAITTMGHVVMMVPSQLKNPALQGTCLKFDFKALFVRPELQGLCNDLSVQTYSASSIAEDYEQPASVEKGDPAAIFFTGGTTGSPKGAVLSHGALMRGAFNGIFAPGSQKNQRYIAFLPFSHIFGVIRSLLAPFYTGALVYTSEDMKASIMTMPLIKPTILVLVPGLAEIIFSLAKLKGAGLLGGRLKTIISGGAPVPPKLLKSFEEFNVNVLPGYGLTETANLVSGNIDVKTKPTSVGKVYPEQEVKLVNGEIWCKGDHIFSGYYKDEETTKAVMEGSWFKTGDLGEFDKDGFLYITGRIKNLIILANGENVSPEAVEEYFYKQDLVKDCLVKETMVNSKPAIGIEILPYAPLVANMDEQEIERKVQAMVDAVNAQMPSYYRVSTFSIRHEDFAKTGSLKISRNQ